ncbi:MAG: hypothetical protein HZB81_07950 [Deltaproteobacteria bacterium]|nr:hypothetical protein [Deltaproteobacteria bacterium]
MNKMTLNYRLVFAFGFAVLLVIGQFGCATPHIAMTPDQTAQLKERLGAIGVASARFAPKVELQTPAKGAADAAGKGAIGGAGVILDASGNSGSGAGAIVGILLIPVGAVVGGVGGAIMADSAEAVNQREAVLKKALADLKVQETMRDHFIKTTQERTVFRFTRVEEEGPAVEGAIPDYRPLSEKGTKTVQEITVKQFGLKGEGRVQPDLSMYMILQARLVNSATNEEIFNKTFSYQGEKHKFADWAANDARLFTEEFDRCYQKLAEDVMREIYVFNNLK